MLCHNKNSQITAFLANQLLALHQQVGPLSPTPFSRLLYTARYYYYYYDYYYYDYYFLYIILFFAIEERHTALILHVILSE